jgi:2-polyprenyl-6-methoxyphenol hydroxylase-like FAD-dependent oxidoreductase
MGQQTDVFVVGGGPVGLAAAIAIRKKGFEVTVADGVSPPIDKACGEGLMPDTLEALQMLGVNARDGEGYAFRGIRFVEGKSSADANFPSGHGIGLRRTVLHRMIVERSTACGVSMMWNTPVTGICDDGAVVKGGVVRAKWIIGADGSNSRVRKWAGLEAHREHNRRFAFRRHYHAKPWSDCMEIYWGPNAQAYVTAVGREEVCVAIVSRTQVGHLEMAIREFPELAARLDRARPVSPDRGAVTTMHSLKRVYRGRVALIGDASGGVDAITGEGLCLGFHQAGALASALQADDLAAYQAAHRRLAWRPRLMARFLLLLDARPALRRRFMRALSSEPDIFERLLAVHVGETSPRHLAATGAFLGWRFLTAN